MSSLPNASTVARHELLTERLLTDVTTHDNSLATGVLDQPHRFLCVLLFVGISTQIAEQYVSALFCETKGNSTADAAVAPLIKAALPAKRSCP